MNRKFRSVLRILVALLAFAKQAAGEVGKDNPTGPTGEYNGSITTAGSYDPYTGNAKRFVTDLTVTGSVGAYPLQWTRVVNSRNGQANAPLGQGGVWSHSYQWGAWVRPERVYHYYDNQYEGPGAEVTYPDGRKMVIDGWYSYPVGSGFGEPGDYLMAVGNGNYNLMMKDGGRVEFTHPSGIHLLATAVVDPYGQRTSLEYDSERRLSKITEPAGRYLQLNYTRYSYTIYFNHEPWSQVRNVDVISSVQAFDGRGNLVETVAYRYQMEQVGQNRYYNLQWVDYADLTHAYYEYYPSESYTHVSGRIKSCNDVRFDGPMKQIQYQYATVNDTPGPIAVGQIKAEKNLLGQIVSEVIYPAPSPHAGSFVRTERRGDGKTRTFQYATQGSGELTSYTDFKGKPSEIGFAYVSPTTYRKDLTDARGYTTSLLKEPGLGAVLRVTHPDINNSFIEYTYSDPSNPYHVASRRDERGHVTHYDRHNTDPHKNRIWRTRYPDGSSEEFTYNGFGQVLTHKLRSGGTETFGYDYETPGAPDRGLKTRHTNAEGKTTLHGYYSSGANTDRLWYTEDPHGNRTWFEYSLRGQITKVMHQDGKYTQSGYNDDGTLAWTADENHPGAVNDPSQRTRYEYDEYKRVRKVINPMGEVTETWYGLNPITWGDELLHTTNNPKYTLSPLGKNVVYDYDENLRKTGQNVALGTADLARTGFEYDETGNLIATTDPRWHVTTFGYDSRNRQIWMKNPVASNRNANGHTMDWEYDEAGNKKKEIRADNAFRSWKYDTMNRLSEATDWRMGEWEPAVTTSYTQSVDGRTRQVTDSKNAVYTTYYDAMNRQTGACYPPDAAGSARCESWQYDAAGNVERHDSVAGWVQSFVYDNRNRRTQSYWWDHVGPHIRTGYDAASRVTSITTTQAGVFESSVAFGYDDANRKVWEEQTVSGYPPRRIETPRDADGHRKHLEVPGWYKVKYAYTERNQLKQIQDGNGTPWFNYTYDVAGNLTKRHDQYGGVNDSINVPSDHYDPLNRPVMWENTKAGDAAYARSWYQYDQVGREVATWRDEEWSPSGGRGDRFDFNVRGQLTRARYSAEQVWTGNAFSPASTEDYQVNALNRESVTRNGVVTAYGPPSGLNQYQAVGSQTLGYDGNFNLTSYDGALFIYDAQNRLLSASKGGATVVFVYDGLGRCVKRTVNGSATLITYDDWKPVMEWDGAGNFQAWNIYGPGADEILWRCQTGVGHLRYHHDRKGNVTSVLDWWGNIVEKYSYDAFGRPVITDWWGNGHYDANGRYASRYGNRFMFQGREWIAELGIYDYRHRMYQPQLGRFLQTDPIGLQTEGEKLTPAQKALFSPGGVAPEAFTSAEVNLFRYCGDDPINKSDPTGLVDLNYAVSDDWTRAYNPADTFVIVGHGNPVDGLVVNGKPISATQIAKDAMANGYNSQCKKIEIVICGSGSGGKHSLAQKIVNALAKLSGAPVEASAPNGKDATTGTKNDQTGVVTPNPPSAVPDPKFGSPGKMENFKADAPKKVKKNDQ